MPRKKKMSTKTIKTTVNLSAAVVEVLKDLAAKQGRTMTSVIHKAVRTEKFFDDVQAKGGKIIVADKNGSVRLLVPR